MGFWHVMILALTWQALASQPAVACENALTTIDMVQCKQVELEQVECILSGYLEASLQRYQDPETRLLIDASQQHWLAYRKASCDAQYQIWREGSIRNLIAVTCLIEYTTHRTLQLWQDYLTDTEGTAPILPDPRQ